MDIAAAIPHRPPFLLIDKVGSLCDDQIEAETHLRPDHELLSRVYAGHYPGHPITPGVLLCEMVFQAAAVLISHRLQGSDIAGTPVLTKIENARFKRMVRPGDTVRITAAHKEQLRNAFYMRGAVHVEDQLALRVEFVVALAPES